MITCLQDVVHCEAMHFKSIMLQFNPHQRTLSFDDLTQNQRLQAEIAMLERVRGQKRKREAGVEHTAR